MPSNFQIFFDLHREVKCFKHSIVYNLEKRCCITICFINYGTRQKQWIIMRYQKVEQLNVISCGIAIHLLECLNWAQQEYGIKFDCNQIPDNIPTKFGGIGRNSLNPQVFWPNLDISNNFKQNEEVDEKECQPESNIETNFQMHSQ